MSMNKISMICSALAVATFMAFRQVIHADFIGFDDGQYVSGNAHVQSGLTMDGIRWAFTTQHASNWHPLTWISHMLDIQLFGLNPHWHHLTNLSFHIATTVLLFLVLHRMTRTLWQSAFVAALFALHPLHVESVAWVAERKDVLSAFFWVLAMGAYGYYAELPSSRRYWLVLVFFGAGLLAKPMLVSLPLVLLLLDYWPLRRFGQIGPDREPADGGYAWSSLRTLLWEKIPLLALAAISCAVTYWVQLKGGAMDLSTGTLSLGVRISNALISYVVYMEKMVWPNNLAIFYPYHRQWLPWQVPGAAFILIAITLPVLRASRRFRFLPVGWFWYLVTLVPVIGLVQVGEQGRADRYTYIPLIGLFIMAAWGIPELVKEWRYGNRVLVASAALTLTAFFVLTRTQAGYWQNSLRLFDHCLQVTDNNRIAYLHRGEAYRLMGDYKQAIADCDRAIKIDPAWALPYNNRGEAYLRLGNFKQAIEDCDRAIGINPNLGVSFLIRGQAYQSLGNRTHARADFDKAIRIDPDLGKVADLLP
ncbi:MAG: tetratricopeptide repeat protein [Oryzomonas sp.]